MTGIEISGYEVWPALVLLHLFIVDVIAADLGFLFVLITLTVLFDITRLVIAQLLWGFAKFEKEGADFVEDIGDDGDNQQKP